MLLSRTLDFEWIVSHPVVSGDKKGEVRGCSED